MRGKGCLNSVEERCQRITPAYAGKRSILYDAIDTMRDHPRLCGEKTPPYKIAVANMRITPAYAGKSALRAAEHSERQDHPRLCGEKTLLFISAGLS